MQGYSPDLLVCFCWLPASPIGSGYMSGRWLAMPLFGRMRGAPLRLFATALVVGKDGLRKHPCRGISRWSRPSIRLIVSFPDTQHSGFFVLRE